MQRFYHCELERFPVPSLIVLMWNKWEGVRITPYLSRLLKRSTFLNCYNWSSQRIPLTFDRNCRIEYAEST